LKITGNPSMRKTILIFTNSLKFEICLLYATFIIAFKGFVDDIDVFWGRLMACASPSKFQVVYKYNIRKKLYSFIITDHTVVYLSIF